MMVMASSSDNNEFSTFVNTNSNTASSSIQSLIGSYANNHMATRRSVSSSPHTHPHRDLPPHVYQAPDPVLPSLPPIPQPPVVAQQPMPHRHPIPSMQTPAPPLPPPPQYAYHGPPIWPGGFPGFGAPGYGAPANFPLYPYHAYMHHQPPIQTTAPPNPPRPTLPTTTHISILNGQSDFAAWHDGVRALIRHMGGFGHIASLADPLLPHRPDLHPSQPPVVTSQSPQAELNACARWWELDNVVQHVLLARLGTSVRMILPEENEDRTARDIYQTLKSNYGANRRTEGTNVFLELLAVRCNPHRLRDYVSTWQNAVTKMRSCRFMVPGYVLSLLFVKNLPDSLAFGSLRSSLGARLENVVEADMEIFKEVLGNVLELDAQFKSVSSTPHSRTLTSASSRNFNNQPPRPPRPASGSLSGIPPSNHLPDSQHGRSAPSTDISLSTGTPATHHGGGQGTRRFDGRNTGPRAYIADGDGFTDHPLLDDGGDIAVFQALEGPSSDVAQEPFDTLPDRAPVTLLSVSSSYPEFVNDNETFDLYDVPYAFVSSSVDLDEALSFMASTSSICVNALLDSGSTHHIFRDKSLFSNYDTSGATSVSTANCGSLEAKGSGDVAIRLRFGDRLVAVTLKDCLYAPDVPINLLSVGSLQHRQIAVRFEPGLPGGSPFTEVVFPPDHPVLPGYILLASVYRQLSFLTCDFACPALALPAVVPTSGLDPPASSAFPRVDLTPALWHRRLGHLGLDAVRALLTSKVVGGLTYTGSFSSVRCVPCLIGKAPQLPYPHNGNRADAIADLLHMDICGPFPVSTPAGCRYFFVILDDASNHGFSSLLHSRSDAFPFYKSTEAFIERATGRRVKATRMDGARELSSGEMGSYLRSRGITVQITAPYAHSQNGKAERYVRTLEDGAQVLLADSGLPASFWGDAVLTVQYVRNRVPTSTIPDGATPFEVFHGKKPDLSHLRVWGCQCFVAIPPELRTKGGPRRFEGLFIGYEENRVGWRVRDLSGKVHFSRDVIFNELSVGRRSRFSRALPPPADISSRPSRQRILSVAGDHLAEALDLSSSSRDARLEHGGESSPVARRSSRLAAKSALLAANWELLVADLVSLATVFPSSVDTSPVSLLSIELDALAFAVFSPQTSRQWNLGKAPLSFAEACARPDAHVWRAAMDREIGSLREMRAFAECPLPPGKKPLDLKWVYDYKTDSDGNIIVGKEKARLVAQGFRQRPEDFGETAAPVAKLTSVRVILAWAASQDLEIFQFDCKTAFLHARLRHDVYCRPVAGWPIHSQGNVLKVLAALYGLRQSAFEFYMLFYSLLLDLGLTRCDSDHGVFFGKWLVSPDSSVPLPSDGSPLVIFVPIHVDDGLVVTNSAPLYHWFLHRLSDRLHIVDLGICSKFLSIVIIRDRPRCRLCLSSRNYVEELLTDWNLSSCRPATTPLSTTILPPISPGNALPDISDADLKPKYQRLVGCLLYLAVSTRPDIAFSAMWLGQFSANPTRAHFLAAKHVLRYLAGTRTLVLMYGDVRTPSPPSLQGFMHNLGCSDADWASDAGDRRSISGYCFFFQNSLVSWSAVKQRAIALSSTEAEYYALTHAFKEALWLRSFLSLLHLPIPLPFPLFSDNQAAISLSSSTSVSSRSKHIDIRYHFLRAHISDGSFSTSWIPTTDMPADIFTKALPESSFVRHRSVLGLVPLP
jgi:hypothetical protein